MKIIFHISNWQIFIRKKIKLRKINYPYILFLIVLTVILEFGSRLLITYNFNNQHIWDINLYRHFYPNLSKIRNYKYNIHKKNILILGGSTVSDETINIKTKEGEVKTCFCHLSTMFPDNRYNILNLAQAGHNSLDSYIKYHLTREVKFDYVFLYDGINDLRTNNCETYRFNQDYKQIEFYDDISIVQEHKEIEYITFIFLIHWTYHLWKKRNKTYIPKEIFPGLINGKPEKVCLEGKNVKSAKTFKKNVEKILDIATKKKEKIIISSFAYYIPLTYSLEAFKKKALDYDQQIYPIELYGLPNNIEKGLQIHNKILSGFRRKKNILYLDLNKVIPKNKKYFDDICHLNKNGCELMKNSIIYIVEKNEN